MPKSTKSHNGMGTVRQRADGRFEARYTGADGKQHSIYGHTSTEVTKALRAAFGTVCWDGDIDYCPDMLYQQSQPL